MSMEIYYQNRETKSSILKPYVNMEHKLNWPTILLFVIHICTCPENGIIISCLINLETYQ